LFVSEPEEQSLHAIVEAVLTVPASQAVQLVAPVFVSVSVTLPASQAGQVSAVLLAAFDAVPAAQSVQLRSSDVVKLASVAL
jgi:hypothetical protein